MQRRLTEETLPRVEQALIKMIQVYKDRRFIDPRGYEIFGFNFIVDADYKPWLVSVTNAPYFTVQNSAELSTVLKHQFELLESRNKEVIQLILDYKQKFVESLQEQQVTELSEQSLNRLLSRDPAFNELVN